MKGGKREDGLHDDTGKVGCIDQTVGRAKGESESEVAKRPYHTCANTLKPGRCDSCRRTYDCNDTAYTAVSVYQRTARERGEATNETQARENVRCIEIPRSNRGEGG